MHAQFVPVTGAAHRANEDGQWPHAQRKSGGRRAHPAGRHGEERNDLPPNTRASERGQSGYQFNKDKRTLSLLHVAARVASRGSLCRGVGNHPGHASEQLKS